jgi:hypothetical protein
MLDLAIAIDIAPDDTTIIETNHGLLLRAPEWPHDCEFQLVAFDPSKDSCEIVSSETLAGDIAEALRAIDAAPFSRDKKPDWYDRLKLYTIQSSLGS